ncbi:MAG TPA: Y-family DNA polymerase [Candidatus Saccharimonadales bacterium]|nr:Y-family DNA polymerase [Candidatus Saccharimonadales bacterium]
MTRKKSIFALVDCNNFFVSCERVFRPDLWDKPVAVLSNNDACIVARSNEVKEMGVPMGAPLFKIDHLMKGKNVTLFSANFRLYGDFSQRVVQILAQAAPEIEVYSVDESFLDISSLPTDDYERWALDLKAQIYQWTGIPVSIGVAPTKTLAKAAAELAKKTPGSSGVHLITDDNREELLRWLPVGGVWGVGWRTAPKLQARGVSTAWDLTQVSEAWIQKHLSIRGLKTVRELKGESCLPLDSVVEPQQSIARTRSFGHNVRDYYQLEGAIATFTAQAAVKLRAQQEVATGVMVFARTPHNFEGGRGSSTVVKLGQPTADTGDLIDAALRGLQIIHDPDFAYRRAGVALVGLVSKEAWQLSLLQDSSQLDKKAALMQSVDSLNTKYNTRLIRHASEHIEKTGWHSKHQRRSPAYTTSWTDLPIIH